MLLFSLSFPKPLLHRRWAWMMLAVLIVASAGLSRPLLITSCCSPQSSAMGDFPGLAGCNHSGLISWLLFWPPMVILAVNYFRLREVNERRRIRLVIFGLLLFFVDLLALFLFSLSPKTFWLSTIAISPLVFGLVAGSFHDLCGVRGS